MNYARNDAGVEIWRLHNYFCACLHCREKRLNNANLTLLKPIKVETVAVGFVPNKIVCACGCTGPRTNGVCKRCELILQGRKQKIELGQAIGKVQAE